MRSNKRESLSAKLSLGWILVLGTVVAIGPLSIDMYLPALPAMEDDLGTDAAGIQWTLAVFFVGLAAGQLAYGPISDRFGRKRPLLVGLTVYAVASVGCALAPSNATLVAFRLLQAIGGCAGMVLTRAVVRDRFPPQDMARILSMLVLVMGVAPMLAPIAGTLLLSHAGWRAIFLALAGFGALCLALVHPVIAESHPVHRRLPQLSLASAIKGYGHLLRHRKFVGYALAGATAQAGMFTYITASAFVFIEVYGMSPTGYSWLFGLNAAGIIAASQVNGLLLRRLPAQAVLRRALQAYLASAAAMTVSAASGWGGVYGIVMPLWICLASLGFTFPNSIAAAMAPFGDRAGSASARLGTLQFALAGTASYLVGHFYNDSALPMAALMTTCGVSALLLLRFAAHPGAPPIGPRSG
jgi:DHA1 family bicyclomycin/chloramphenicol resistance-like MFS transporter